MKEVITSVNGGMPIVLDDIRFQQSGVKEAIKGIAMPYMDENDNDDFMILSGLLKIGSDITSGYVFYKGEVFYCPGKQNAFNNYNKIAVVESYDPAGLKVFKSNPANPIDTYLIREMALFTDSTAPSDALTFIAQSTSLDHTWYYHRRVVESVKSSIQPFQIINEQVIPVGGIMEGTYRVYGKVDFSNTIHLKGQISFEDIPDDKRLFSLPMGFPVGFDTDFKLIVYAQSSSEYRPCVLRFYGSMGVLAVDFHRWVGAGMYAGVISFDGISFSLL